MLLWLKALHVIAVISWMAGLLYLPRLFVYHCEAEKGSKQSETFKVMEQRLLRFIMNPAMIVVWVTGPWLAWAQGMVYDRWLWAKFALVVAADRLSPRAGRLAQGLSPRTATARRAVLPDRQRGADAADGRHRHPGDREAVLETSRLSPDVCAHARQQALCFPANLLYVRRQHPRPFTAGGCGPRAPSKVRRRP